MSALQASGFMAVVTQGVALGWDMAAPLALSKGKGGSLGAPGFVARSRGANTGISPLRCAPVEMTDLRLVEESGRFAMPHPLQKAQRVGYPELWRC